MKRSHTLILLAVIVLAAGGFIVMTAIRKWPGSAPEPYRNAIAAAEIREGLPHNLLARLLWQESHFRPEIINGSLPSPAGALGIAQIVPRWHPNVNPLDPFASIDYAARYLRDLRRQFGTWELALAAYNWGIGNLRKGITAWGASAVLTHPTTPQETRNYVAQIAADVLYNV